MCSSPPAPVASVSMLGQPPSEPDDSHLDESCDPSDFDSVLKRIYKKVESEAWGGFGSIIMKEKISGSSNLMEGMS